MKQMHKRLLLLFYHLYSSKKPITSEKLADLCGVTSRTIKNDIGELKDYLKLYDAEILAIPGTGYQLKIGNPQNILTLVQELKLNEIYQYKNVPQYQYQRVDYVIKKLILVNYPIKLEDLMEELYISRTTLTKVLHDVRSTLSKYNLKIVHRPHYGIEIQGNEISKRLCIVEHFFHNPTNNEFISPENILLSGLNNQPEIKVLEEGLIKILGEHQIHLSDLSVQNMVMHIIVTLRRRIFSEEVRLEPNQLVRIKQKEEYAAASELGEIIESKFNVILPEDEIAYFALHIACKRIYTDSYTSKQEREELDYLLNKIFDKVQESMGYDLHQDNELKGFLYLHIPPMAARLQIGFMIRNPFIMETLKKYPLAVKMTCEACSIINKFYNIRVESNEFCYLVLYFNLALLRKQEVPKKNVLLICGRGRSEMELLTNEIRHNFGNLINKVTAEDIFDPAKIQWPEFDLVISTREANIPENVNQLNISNIYNSNYLELIQTELLKTPLTNKKLEFWLSRISIINNIRAHNKGDVIHEFSIFLKAIGFEGKIEEKILLCEAIISSEIGNKCAFIHALSSSIEESKIVIGVCKHPVLWDNQEVQILIYGECAFSDRGMIDTLYKLLQKISNKDDLVSILRENSPLDSMKKWLQ